MEIFIIFIWLTLMWIAHRIYWFTVCIAVISGKSKEEMKKESKALGYES